MKILFEVRRFDGEDRIFIDNQLFDWGLDEVALEKIKGIDDQVELSKVNDNIKNFLLSCLESHIGRKVTIKQVLDAIELGYIEK